MSYQITNWKTKKLENLIIPITALYADQNYHPSLPTITDIKTNEVKIEDCESTIKGILKDGQLTITELDISGEGSGGYYENVVEPALAKSTGLLEARLTWEGGDSIENLTVKDGQIESESL